MTRLAAEAVDLRIFHIPKTAGTSIHHELKALGHGAHEVREICMRPHLLHGPRAFNFMMFREPRAHVLSLFMHCKYHLWARAANATWRRYNWPYTAPTDTSTTELLSRC
jgi:hypothetical protein